MSSFDSVFNTRCDIKMKVLFRLLVLYGSIFVSVQAQGSCSRYDIGNATVSADYSLTANGKNVWAVGAPSMKLSMNVSCNPRFDYFERNYIYFLRNGETIVDATYVGYFRFFYDDDCQKRSSRIILTCYLRNASFVSITAVISNVTMDMNLSSLALSRDRGRIAYLKSRPFLLKYCDDVSLTSELRAESPSKRYSYGDNATVTCANGDIFQRKTDYTPSMQIRCGIHAEWEIPAFDCDDACGDPSFYNSKLQESAEVGIQRKYRRGTKINLSCANGRMYFVKRPDRFIQSVPATCVRRESWSHNEADCWTGQVVDFTRSNLTLLSGESTIFTCGAQNFSTTVNMKIGNDTIGPKMTIWRNITLTPDFHEVATWCEELNRVSTIIKRREILLTVLYPPEITGDPERLQYEMQKGTSGHVIIEFRANPAVSESDIVLFKNGTQMHHFYLLVDGVNHQLVVDFIQVTQESFGNYVMTVTSHPPVESTLTLKFTVIEEIIRDHDDQHSSSIALPIGISVGVVAAIAVSAIVVYLLLLKPWIAAKGNAANQRRNEPAVRYQRRESDEDPHNYEDIDQPVPSQQQRVFPNSGNTKSFVSTPAACQNDNIYDL